MSAKMAGGTARQRRGQNNRCQAGRHRPPLRFRQIPDEHLRLEQRIDRQCRAQPEQLAQLSQENDDRDPARESGNHRIRNVFDQRAKPEHAHRDQHRPRHQRSHRQPAGALRRNNPGENRDESTGRSTDPHSTYIESGNEKPADDRGLKAWAGVTPEAMANPIASGSATIATVIPASRSLTKARPL